MPGLERLRTIMPMWRLNLLNHCDENECDAGQHPDIQGCEAGAGHKEGGAPLKVDHREQGENEEETSAEMILSRDEE